MRVFGEETGAKHDPAVMAVFREVIENSPFRVVEE
jgi:hypothetical protein